MPKCRKAAAGFMIMEANKNIYDNIDPRDYENRGHATPIEKYQHSHWQPLVAAAIAKYSPGMVVLDLGCGPGNRSSEMAKYAKRVLGVDSSGRMIDYAKKTYPTIDFMHADATKTTLENNSVDTVFSFGLFEYAPKEKLMQEISRVLRPGGTGIILAPNKYSMPRFLYATVCALIGKKRVVSEPSFGQMLKLFTTFHFEVVDYTMDDGLFFLPHPLHRLFGPRTWLFIEKCFKGFKRNPLSMNMLFIIKKR